MGINSRTTSAISFHAFLCSALPFSLVTRSDFLQRVSKPIFIPSRHIALVSKNLLIEYIMTPKHAVRVEAQRRAADENPAPFFRSPRKHKLEQVVGQFENGGEVAAEVGAA